VTLRACTCGSLHPAGSLCPRAIAGAEGFDWFTISGADAARWRYIATRAIAALVPHHIERQRMTVECVMNVEPHEAARLIHDELGKRMRRNAGVA
jgi:hypothetical protein